MTSVTIGLAAVNTLLLTLLARVYYGNYRDIGSEFTLGLLVFAGLLLVENIIALYFNITMMGLYAQSVAYQAMVMRGIETAALLTLTYITWKH